LKEFVFVNLLKRNMKFQHFYNKTNDDAHQIYIQPGYSGIFFSLEKGGERK
jgi:hypothetical protein